MTLIQEAEEAAGLGGILDPSMVEVASARHTEGDAVIVRIGKASSIFNLSGETLALIGVDSLGNVQRLAVQAVTEGETRSIPLPVGFRGDIHAFLTDADVKVTLEPNFSTEQAEDRARNLNAQAEAEPGALEKAGSAFGKSFGLNAGAGLVVTLIIGLGALYYFSKKG